MKSRLKLLATSATVTVISIATLPAATAAGNVFWCAASAGGTQLTAVGLTVSSDLTAPSSVFGAKPKEASNKVATVKVGGLLQAGAITTDAKSVPSADGIKTTGHARTLNVSLLNGAIKASAVDTSSTAQLDSSGAPIASSSTELVGLTIGGKKYPVNVAPNTGVSIPGVATVVINASQTATSETSVATQGAGLIVTLLRPRNGVAAGAMIVVNPTRAVVAPLSKEGGGLPLGGGGVSAYAFAHVGDDIQAETGLIGGQATPATGSNGEARSNTTAKVNVPQLLTAKTAGSSVTSIAIPALSEVTASSTLADLKLFPTLSGALISATAIGSTAHTRVDDGTPITEGDLQFVNLKIGGKAIPADVPPNTTLHIAGLGTVVINEQKQIRVNGVAHFFRVIGLHITLDTARAGLPIGAEVQISTSQAIVYG